MINNQVGGNSNISISLPTNIAKALEQALALLPEGKTATIEVTKSEGTFNHILFVTTASERYVFRARRDISTVDGEDYMRCMYEYTGFLEAGGSFKLRNITEEIDFIKRALAVGLPVPKLIHAGRDWMLIEYIEGRTLFDFLVAGEVSILPKILHELNLAHRKGIIYADRWGGNEMIDSHGNVRMIDFDIEWFYHGTSQGILESLEMAVTIFNAMRLTSTRDDLLKIVKSDALPLLKAWDYQIETIGKFIAGLCKYYLAPDKPSNAWSLPTDYTLMAEPANRLVTMFSQVI